MDTKTKRPQRNPHAQDFFMYLHISFSPFLFLCCASGVPSLDSIQADSAVTSLLVLSADRQAPRSPNSSAGSSAAVAAGVASLSPHWPFRCALKKAQILLAVKVAVVGRESAKAHVLAIFDVEASTAMSTPKTPAGSSGDPSVFSLPVMPSGGFNLSNLPGLMDGLWSSDSPDTIGPLGFTGVLPDGASSLLTPGSTTPLIATSPLPTAPGNEESEDVKLNSAKVSCCTLPSWPGDSQRPLNIASMLLLERTNQLVVLANSDDRPASTEGASSECTCSTRQAGDSPESRRGASMSSCILLYSVRPQLELVSSAEIGCCGCSVLRLCLASSSFLGSDSSHAAQSEEDGVSEDSILVCLMSSGNIQLLTLPALQLISTGFPKASKADASDSEEQADDQLVDVFYCNGLEQLCVLTANGKAMFFQPSHLSQSRRDTVDGEATRMESTRLTGHEDDITDGEWSQACLNVSSFLHVLEKTILPFRFVSRPRNCADR